MPLAVDDVLQITYECRLASQVILSVLHARVDTAPSGSPTTEAALQDLADKCADETAMDFLAKYIAATVTDFTFVRVLVQRVKPTRSIYFESPIAETGVIGAANYAADSAISFKKRTTTVGRKGIGRMQLAGFGVNQITSGVVDSGFIGGVGGDLAAAMAGTFTGGIAYPSGVYRWCLPAGGADHAFDIFDVVVQDTARTMHRRTVGLGI
jgi:hypothetical protein